MLPFNDTILLVFTSNTCNNDKYLTFYIDLMILQLKFRFINDLLNFYIPYHITYKLYLD